MDDPSLMTSSAWTELCPFLVAALKYYSLVGEWMWKRRASLVITTDKQMLKIIEEQIEEPPEQG